MLEMLFTNLPGNSQEEIVGFGPGWDLQENGLGQIIGLPKDDGFVFLDLKGRWFGILGILKDDGFIRTITLAYPC